MKVGYVRISTKEQNTARQDVMMVQLGVERIFTDRVSGKNTERPELHKVMDFVRDRDMLVVESFSRFARKAESFFEDVYLSVKAGNLSAAAGARELGIARSTWYRKAKEYENEQYIDF